MTCVSARATTLYSVAAIPLPVGAVSLRPLAINASGQVVGEVTFADHRSPFSFSGGALTILASPTGHNATTAASINDAGEIVGYTTDDRGIPKSAYWSSASDTNPQVLESGGGSDANVYATGINNAGMIGGYFTGSGSGNAASWRAVRWTLSGSRWRQDVLPRALVNPPLGAFHAGFGLNDLGDIVGTGSAANVSVSTGQAAVKWDAAGNPAGLTLLAAEPVAPRYQALAINNAGAIVGDVTDNVGHTHALLWSATGSVTDLGLSVGFVDSTLTDLNAGGLATGRQSTSTAQTTAFLNAQGAWVQLRSRLLTPAGWTLTDAATLNDAAVVAGTGTLGGIATGVVLTPAIDATPGDANLDLAVGSTISWCSPSITARRSMNPGRRATSPATRPSGSMTCSRWPSITASPRRWPRTGHWRRPWCPSPRR